MKISTAQVYFSKQNNEWLLKGINITLFPRKLAFGKRNNQSATKFADFHKAELGFVVITLCYHSFSLMLRDSVTLLAPKRRVPLEIYDLRRGRP